MPLLAFGAFGLDLFFPFWLDHDYWKITGSKRCNPLTFQEVNRIDDRRERVPKEVKVSKLISLSAVVPLPII